MSRSTWTISQLIGYIKNRFNNDAVLHNISVTGEVGNFTRHYSGHWYFTLKDNNALINCAMFRGYNQQAGFIPQNGNLVIAAGNVSVFEKSGQMQLLVTNIIDAGGGDFYAQFEKTRRKLEPLGYFDPAGKKAIPCYPKQISVVTGANTAALQDVKITISKRWPVILRERYALVQGREAVESVIQALKLADQDQSDVIILARGGGSVDDLWCFNDENIARAIYECKTPVITGIGHEIDTTIADLVADLRAATPTAAAVAATPDINEVVNQISSTYDLLIRKINDLLAASGQELDYDYLKLRNFENRITILENRIRNSRNEMALSLMKHTEKAAGELRYLHMSMKALVTNRVEKSQADLSYNTRLLDSLSPLKVMERGYSVTLQNDQIIRRAADVDIREELTVRFSDGSIKAGRLEKENDDGR